MSLYDDWDTVPAKSAGNVDEAITRAIQEYPTLAARVAEVQSAQTAAQIAVNDFEQRTATNAPPAVRATLAELTAATIAAASSLSDYRQRIREGVAEAKKAGTVNAADLAKLSAAGLAGFHRFAPVWRSGSSAAMIRAAASVGKGVEGLGVLPSMLRSSGVRAAIAHGGRAASFATSGSGARGSGARGGGRGVRGLGVLPLVAIGYGLAVAIGAAIVGGSLVAAYRLTSESVARAESVRDQNAAALDAWRAQVALQQSTQTPGAPLPSLPELPQSGGIVATVARTATPLILVAALAVGAAFILRKRAR